MRIHAIFRQAVRGDEAADLQPIVVEFALDSGEGRPSAPDCRQFEEAAEQHGVISSSARAARIGGRRDSEIAVQAREVENDSRRLDIAPHHFFRPLHDHALRRCSAMALPPVPGNDRPARGRQCQFR